MSKHERPPFHNPFAGATSVRQRPGWQAVCSLGAVAAVAVAVLLGGVAAAEPGDPDDEAPGGQTALNLESDWIEPEDPPFVGADEESTDRSQDPLLVDPEFPWIEPEDPPFVENPDEGPGQIVAGDSPLSLTVVITQKNSYEQCSSGGASGTTTCVDPRSWEDVVARVPITVPAGMRASIEQRQTTNEITGAGEPVDPAGVADCGGNFSSRSGSEFTRTFVLQLFGAGAGAGGTEIGSFDGYDEKQTEVSWSTYSGFGIGTRCERSETVVERARWHEYTIE